jgi:hypothetical protein
MTPVLAYSGGFIFSSIASTLMPPFRATFAVRASANPTTRQRPWRSIASSVMADQTALTVDLTFGFGFFFAVLGAASPATTASMDSPVIRVLPLI